MLRELLRKSKNSKRVLGNHFGNINVYFNLIYKMVHLYFIELSINFIAVYFYSWGPNENPIVDNK